jgi:1,4-dihydroxy-2-naphthoate octaprenyltransferase
MSKTSNEKQSKPSTLKIWVTAARPHTLTASIAPVLVAHQAVYGWILKQSQEDNAPVEISTLYLSITFAAFACLVQLGTNLHNDYADFIKGADTDKRGWLSC